MYQRSTKERDEYCSGGCSWSGRENGVLQAIHASRLAGVALLVLGVPLEVSSVHRRLGLRDDHMATTSATLRAHLCLDVSLLHRVVSSTSSPPTMQCSWSAPRAQKVEPCRGLSQCITSPGISHTKAQVNHVQALHVLPQPNTSPAVYCAPPQAPLLQYMLESTMMLAAYQRGLCEAQKGLTVILATEVGGFVGADAGGEHRAGEDTRGVLWEVRLGRVGIEVGVNTIF